VRPFIRFVEDLEGLKTRGTNEDLFRGEDYAQLPPNIADSIRGWCARNLGVEQLRSDAGSEDEPLEAYVVRIGTKEGRKELRGLVAELSAALAETVLGAVQTVDPNTVMTNKTHAAFDALEEAARLRTVLLRVLDRARHKRDKAPALLLEV
jgi:hypothetical protein